MASKFVALLVVCLVLVAAVELPCVQADDFGLCFNTCKDECTSGGQGSSFCEMKCDTDCFDKEIAARLHFKIPPN